MLVLIEGRRQDWHVFWAKLASLPHMEEFLMFVCIVDEIVRLLAKTDLVVSGHIGKMEPIVPSLLSLFLHLLSHHARRCGVVGTIEVFSTSQFA